VLALILLPMDLTATTAIAEDDISGLDFDDGVAGFQASFARLGASEAKKEDPVAWLVEDEKTFLKTQLEGVAGSVSRSFSASSRMGSRGEEMGWVGGGRKVGRRESEGEKRRADLLLRVFVRSFVRFSFVRKVGPLLQQVDPAALAQLQS